MRHVKSHHVISALTIGGAAFFAFAFSAPPLFENLDSFVLFAQEEIKLEYEVQVSSGDLGSNKKLDIEKDNIINGNLFAKEITIDKNSTINGNVSFNKLKLNKDSQILGTQTKPVSLPIANISEIPAFPIGTQDFKFEGEDNTLAAGSYRNIILEKNSKLVLNGGTYNLRKLELKDGAVLIFNAPTTLHIQFKLRGHDKVSILPGQNLKPDDLVINYLGIKSKKEKEEKEDDDGEIESEMDEKEKKDFKKGKIGRPIKFGEQSFLNFKLLAPKASVRIGKESILRGQILARKIKIEKDGILSREEFFEKESDPAKVVEDQGVRFLVNEIIILLSDNATINNAQEIANLVNAKIDGFVPNPPTYKLNVSANTPAQLFALVQQIKDAGNPLLIEAIPNLISQ